MLFHLEDKERSTEVRRGRAATATIRLDAATVAWLLGADREVSATWRRASAAREIVATFPLAPSRQWSDDTVRVFRRGQDRNWLGFIVDCSGWGGIAFDAAGGGRVGAKR